MRHPFRLDFDVDRHRGGAGPLGGVHGRLSAGREQGAQLVVEWGVADGDGLDGDTVGGFDLSLDLRHAGRQRRRSLRPERPGSCALRTATSAARALGRGRAWPPPVAGWRSVGSWPGSGGPSRGPGRPCPPAPRPVSAPGARRRGRAPASATTARRRRRLRATSTSAPPRGRNGERLRSSSSMTKIPVASRHAARRRGGWRALDANRRAPRRAGARRPQRRSARFARPARHCGR